MRDEQDDFLDRFQEMMLFESNGFPANHPFSKVAAMPTGVPLPPIWLLGSSGYSAELAAHVGAGFSFAHHFSDFPPEGPMLNYRNQFKPSAWRQTPYAILGVAAIVADTEAEADRMAIERGPAFRAPRQGRIRPARLARRGRRLSLHADRPPAHRAQPQAADRRLGRRRRASASRRSSDATKADEVMVTTMVFDHAARKHSYALLAQAFGLQGAGAAVAAGAR